MNSLCKLSDTFLQPLVIRLGSKCRICLQVENYISSLGCVSVFGKSTSEIIIERCLIAGNSCPWHYLPHCTKKRGIGCNTDASESNSCGVGLFSDLARVHMHIKLTLCHILPAWGGK